MKKEDFKIVRGVATIANMTTALYIGNIIIWAIFIFKKEETIFMHIGIGFSILTLVSLALNIIGARRINELEFKGTSKNFAKLALKHSYWIIFPILFTITINRLRGRMWDYVISSKTSHISDPYEKLLVNDKILDELKEDGFISQYTYDNRKEKIKSSIKGAKKISDKLKKELKLSNEKKNEDWL